MGNDKNTLNPAKDNDFFDLIENNVDCDSYLSELYKKFKLDSMYSFGFPLNMEITSESLLPLFKLHINNFGSPFVKNSFKLNSKHIEKKVLNFYAQQYGLNKDNHWGYITTGGSESNECGLLIAREYYPEGILYFSDATHGCVYNAAKKLRMNFIQIESDNLDEINYQSLIKSIKLNLSKNPKAIPIIVANIGTTFYGANDNLKKIVSMLSKNKINKFYIHCDAALFGGYFPFMPSGNPLHFSTPFHSISISLHKFLGTPIPSSVFLTKSESNDILNISLPASKQEYINCNDNFLSTSRSGLAPLIAWYQLKKLGYSGLQNRVINCLKMLDYSKKSLLNMGYDVFAHEKSNILVIRNVINKGNIIEKWQLMVVQNDLHITFLPHIKKEMLDIFLNDMKMLL